MKPSTLINKLGKENAADSNKIIDAIRKLGGNKSCFDCGEKGVTYVVPKFGIFICTRCSGIHRELGTTVKGFGVSNFNEKEIKILQDMGNDNAYKIWMAKFNESKHSLPKPSDDSAVKNHIKIKYFDKKWYSSSGATKEEETSKKKNNQDDESDPDDVDIKPSSLKKKTKPSIKEVEVKTKEKEKEKKIEKEKEEVKNTSIKLSKISIGGNSNKQISSNNNNQEGWKANFNENKVSKPQTQQVDPFDMFNNNQSAKSNPFSDNPFEFASDVKGNNDNPFDWGDNNNNANNNKQSLPNNNEIQNKPQSNMFDFNFTTSTTTTTNSQTSQPNNNNSTSISINNNNLKNIMNNINYNGVNNSEQNVPSTNNKSSSNFDNNNYDSNQFTEVKEEKPKKNLDDIMNMLNNTNLNGNSHQQGQPQMGMGGYGGTQPNMMHNMYGGMNNMQGGMPNMQVGMPNMQGNIPNMQGMNMLNFQQLAQNPQFMMMFNNMMQQQKFGGGNLGGGYNMNMGGTTSPNQGMPYFNAPIDSNENMNNINFSGSSTTNVETQNKKVRLKFLF